MIAIVISILLAFALQAWWDANQRRGEEREALQRLGEELVSVDAVMERAETNHRHFVDACEALLAHSSPGGSTPLTADSVATLVGALVLTFSLDVPSATLTYLESSGQLGLIRSQELIAELAAWRAELTDLQDDERVLGGIVNANLVPYLISNTALRTVTAQRAGDDSAMGVQWGTYSTDVSRFESGLQELLARREFESLLDVRLNWEMRIVTNYQSVREGLATVARTIQEELEQL